MSESPYRATSLGAHSHRWVDQWLQDLRELPRVITAAELESLKLIIFSGGQSYGISDGAARIRYLVGAKLISVFSIGMNEPVNDQLTKALTEVIADGQAAAEELCTLAPGLLIGVTGQRAPNMFDLQRMGLEYKSGFALSPLTLGFCKMRSVDSGAKLFALIQNEASHKDCFTTISLLSSGASAVPNLGPRT